MGRLANLKPQLNSLAPRLGYAPGDVKAQDKARNDAAPWRHLYKTARWQKLRLRVFLRDTYTCRQTGVLLSGKHPAPNSPVADHIIAHRGDPTLFWDEANVQTVSKAWHDAEKQRQEARERARGGP